MTGLEAALLESHTAKHQHIIAVGSLVVVRRNEIVARIHRHIKRRIQNITLNSDVHGCTWSWINDQKASPRQDRSLASVKKFTAFSSGPSDMLSYRRVGQPEFLKLPAIVEMNLHCVEINITRW